MNLRTVGMWLCCILFFTRVVGQIMVGLYAPAWLPPMEAWYSGLVPYPILLTVQLALLMLMAAITTEQTLHGSSFQQARPSLGRWLRRVACLYAAAMALRYLIASQVMDIQFWYDGGLIPVLFHWVLAGFIWLAACGSEVHRLRHRKL